MRQQVSELLIEMETALKTTALWSNTQPDPTALASTAPFCCDTLPLAQWLQFVLIPKLRQLIATGAPLPTKIAVLPIAEHVYANDSARVAPLLTVIARLDQCLNQP